MSRKEAPGLNEEIMSRDYRDWKYERNESRINSSNFTNRKNIRNNHRIVTEHNTVEIQNVVTSQFLARKESSNVSKSWQYNRLDNDVTDHRQRKKMIDEKSYRNESGKNRNHSENRYLEQSQLGRERYDNTETHEPSTPAFNRKRPGKEQPNPPIGRKRSNQDLGHYGNIFPEETCRKRSFQSYSGNRSMSPDKKRLLVSSSQSRSRSPQYNRTLSREEVNLEDSISDVSLTYSENKNSIDSSHPTRVDRFSTSGRYYTEDLQTTCTNRQLDSVSQIGSENKNGSYSRHLDRHSDSTSRRCYMDDVQAGNRELGAMSQTVNSKNQNNDPMINTEAVNISSYPGYTRHPQTNVQNPPLNRLNAQNSALNVLNPQMHLQKSTVVVPNPLRNVQNQLVKGIGPPFNYVSPQTNLYESLINMQNHPMNVECQPVDIQIHRTGIQNPTNGQMVEMNSKGPRSLPNTSVDIQNQSMCIQNLVTVLTALNQQMNTKNSSLNTHNPPVTLQHSQMSGQPMNFQNMQESVQNSPGTAQSVLNNLMQFPLEYPGTTSELDIRSPSQQFPVSDKQSPSQQFPVSDKQSQVTVKNLGNTGHRGAAVFDYSTHSADNEQACNESKNQISGIQTFMDSSQQSRAKGIGPQSQVGNTCPDRGIYAGCNNNGPQRTPPQPLYSGIDTVQMQAFSVPTAEAAQATVPEEEVTVFVGNCGRSDEASFTGFFQKWLDQFDVLSVLKSFQFQRYRYYQLLTFMDRKAADLVVEKFNFTTFNSCVLHVCIYSPGMGEHAEQIEENESYVSCDNTGANTEKELLLCMKSVLANVQMESFLRKVMFRKNRTQQFISLCGRSRAEYFVTNLNGACVNGNVWSLKIEDLEQKLPAPTKVVPSTKAHIHVPRRDECGGFSIHISNLGKELTKVEFRKSFKKALIKHKVCFPWHNPVKKYIFKKGRFYQDVVFYKEEQAVAAIEALNNSHFMGHNINVQ